MKITVLMENTSKDPERLAAEHGLSLYIETEKHRILADTGASDLTWDNAEKLGVDLSSVDTVVISHGHYDHAGGLMGFARRNPAADIYMQRSAGGNFCHGDRYIGIDREILLLPRLHLLDGDLRLDDELAVHTGVTGRRLWPRSNIGLSEIVDGVPVQDRFRHEQFLVIREGGQLVMISGCAHNGILNLLDRFRELYGTDPDAVVSGFHMMKREDYTPEETEEILGTARILAETKTVWYTGHCTGRKAVELMAPVMGDRLREINVGITIEKNDHKTDALRYNGYNS